MKELENHWGPQNPHPLSKIRTELVWEGKYETIEAEVVFLYRQESGQWPQEQTEIHFHPSSNIHRQCARQVVDALKEKSTANKRLIGSPGNPAPGERWR